MPELPEVETLKRQLENVLLNKKISQIEILRSKNFIGDPKVLETKTITQIKRKAKVIIIYFQKEFPCLLVHLKMTGQLIFDDQKNRVFGGHPNNDFFASLPSKYTRVIIHFSDNSKLFFNDQRTFGWLKIISSQVNFDQEFKNLNGIEPFSPIFTWQNLKTNLFSSRPIKLVILDQSKIAGIGNIYANDGLFLSRLLPTRKANSLSDKDWQNLAKSLKKILSLSLLLGGTSQTNYIHLDGKKGNYQDHFLVYRKDNQPCPKCQNPIQKIKLGGRGTFFCPICQK